MANHVEKFNGMSLLEKQTTLYKFFEYLCLEVPAANRVLLDSNSFLVGMRQTFLKCMRDAAPSSAVVQGIVVIPKTTLGRILEQFSETTGGHCATVRDALRSMLIADGKQAAWDTGSGLVQWVVAHHREWAGPPVAAPPSPLPAIITAAAYQALQMRLEEKTQELDELQTQLAETELEWADQGRRLREIRRLTLV